MAALFEVNDPYEMNVLLRALFVAKFHAPDDGPELAGSPILARLCERVVASVRRHLAEVAVGRSNWGRWSRMRGSSTSGCCSARMWLPSRRYGNWPAVPRMPNPARHRTAARRACPVPCRGARPVGFMFSGGTFAWGTRDRSE